MAGNTGLADRAGHQRCAPELTGTGVAGSTVHILDNGVEIGTALVSASGNWSFTPSTDLASGPTRSAR
jgi:hypothetical protein